MKKQIHRKAKARPMSELLRSRVRAQLHAQLDMLLKNLTDLPIPPGQPAGTQPDVGTVLDDCVLRGMLGYGFNVSLSVRHPDEEGMVAEDPSVTASLEGPAPAPIILLP